jgi:hypothetical protein
MAEVDMSSSNMSVKTGIFIFSTGGTVRAMFLFGYFTAKTLLFYSSFC